MGMKTFPLVDAAKPPCPDAENGCLITFFSATLQYPNGSVANANNGMWLHHTVILAQNESDTTCPVWPADENGEGGGQEARIFASGNERTRLDLTHNGTVKAGYHFRPSDNWLVLTELMNQVDEAREAVLVITYEFIPYAPSPEEFGAVTPVWLDIGGLCSDSEVPVPEKQEAQGGGYYNAVVFVQPKPWVPDFSGQVLYAGAHLHDGGVNLDVLRNGKVVCEGVVAYGETDDYIEHMPLSSSLSMEGGEEGEMNMDTGAEMKHISSITGCYDVGPVEKGDQWSVRASYNFTQHPGMMGADGSSSLAPIMGIAIMYVLA